ncbi:PD-(D/E)XK nuclease family protein [Bradyrhizobium guangxiense]|uniref:PD-(D/E)XK nuclease family protein n=1 Tax=Bradyrhizobium guangxiense TaxID=1325115 RepID=UPI0013E8D122|nr:PD-(D/E)XK nuclease family protein [Bradyrhizobium guangxiense]
MSEHGVSDVLLPRLYERDIDVLIQEELLFNESVRYLFSKALKLPHPIQIDRCALSVSDSTGETDIYARFSCGELRGALLIENKIDAAFQPTQPERYRKRAALLSSQLGVKVYCCLIAPAAYDVSRSGSSFDAVITYERIADAIATQADARSEHRAKLIQHAISLARRSYVAVPSDEVTHMWGRVYEIASASYPDLKMKPPGTKGSDSVWISFKASLPPNVTIDWKITKSVVALSFWPSSSQKPVPGLDLTELGAFADKTGNTVLIRIGVSSPPAKWVDATDGQIHEALTAAASLLKFYHTTPTAFA